jgi:predicted transcriptional regulator
MVCDLRHKEKQGRVKRVQVTFTEEQWSLIERFRGAMGNDDAEIVRNIVLAWLAEKSVVAESVKRSLSAEGGAQR